jgi:acyl-CoA thioesterase-2
MMTPLSSVLALLDLEPIEVNLFRGRSPQEERQRVFGGQVLAQALVAAGRTVEDRSAHSFHAYFLRPGDPTVPILYEVDRIRDGKSFTTRRVVAVQHGRAIFNMSASFQIEEPGLEHQAPMPDAPLPEELPTAEEYREVLKKSAPPGAETWFDGDRAFEERYADPINWYKPEKQAPHQRIWLRASEPLPDDPALHQAILAYVSDMSLLDSAAMPHAISWVDPQMQIASLDHAMWFHRPFRADEWLLYVSESPSASNARGLATGSIYTRDGRLVCTVAQEGLMRKQDLRP